MWVELDLTEAPPEVVAADPLAVLRGRRRPSLRSVVDALHDAAADPHVVGLVAKVGAGMPLARAQELRDAVVAFAARSSPRWRTRRRSARAAPARSPY